MCLLLVLLILLLPAGHSRSQLSDCDVRTYGARCDNSTDDTAALQVAIDACAPQRRRVVIGSAGVCLSRPLTLRSHTELVVAKGTTLKALRNKLADTPFVYAVNATGISVLGNGTIDGSGAQWWAARRSNKALGRPHLIRFDNVSHVLLENLTLLNAANHFTNLHGSHYRIYGLSIRSPSSHIAPNTDGINTKCTDVHIRGCDITNGDDSVVMKAPSIDVLVEDTIVRQGNGFVVGTADDTFEHSFKNITFRRSIAEGTMFGAHVIISSRAARADPSMVCSGRGYHCTGSNTLRHRYQPERTEHWWPRHHEIGRGGACQCQCRLDRQDRKRQLCANKRPRTCGRAFHMQCWAVAVPRHPAGACPAGCSTGQCHA